MIHTMLYLCFPKLIDVFKSNGYSKNFINNYLKVLLDNKHRIQEKVINEPIFSVLPYLGPLSLQTRTMLRKSFKDLLNCYKLQIIIKNQTPKHCRKHFKRKKKRKIKFYTKKSHKAVRAKDRKLTF